MSVNFQDEGEVQEYLKNIGTEYRFGCYSEKNPESCHLLADYLETIKKDFDKARKVYQSNCYDYSHGKSCYKFGSYAFLGKGAKGTKGDTVEALKAYEKGCETGEPGACLHAGLLHTSKALKDEKLEQNFMKGLECLTKSCELNNDRACFLLSGMHITGDENAEKLPIEKKTTTALAPTLAKVNGEMVVAKDMLKAFAFAYKACELKNMYACANVSQMYMRGEGTEKNNEKAEKYKQIAMEMQNEITHNKSQLVFQQTS